MSFGFKIGAVVIEIRYRGLELKSKKGKGNIWE